MTETKYPTLPHDEWYDDWTWDYVLGEPLGYWDGEAEGRETFAPEQVAEIELWHVAEGDFGPEHNAAGLFRMKDDSYVVYTGWCDTTGWDCQSGARFTFHKSREDAVRFGLGDEERSWFGITMEEPA